MGRYTLKNDFTFGSTWPTNFLKETIGIERNGVIIQQQNTPLIPDSIEVSSNTLEAIKTMRLKGYNVVIFFNEPQIVKNEMTVENVDFSNQKLMEIFGNYGIQTITGLYYSTSNFKDDIYSMPNNGMLKKAETELKIKFKGGYFVGDKLYNLKVAETVNSTPILIRQGLYEETKKKLKTFANRNLKQKVKEYDNLLDFANNLS